MHLLGPMGLLSFEAILGWGKNQTSTRRQTSAWCVLCADVAQIPPKSCSPRTSPGSEIGLQSDTSK